MVDVAAGDSGEGVVEWERRAGFEHRRIDRRDSWNHACFAIVAGDGTVGPAPAVHRGMYAPPRNWLMGALDGMGSWSQSSVGPASVVVGRTVPMGLVAAVEVVGGSCAPVVADARTNGNDARTNGNDPWNEQRGLDDDETSYEEVEKTCK